MSLLGSLASIFLAELSRWGGGDRQFTLHTKLGADALLVEQVDGIESVIGGILPDGDLPLPHAARFMPGSLTAAQTALPRMVLGHTPAAPALVQAEREPAADLLCGYRFEVIAVGAVANLDLNTLLGTPVLLEWQTAASRTELRPLHGYVSEAESLGSNGGLARYRLVIEPWLGFLRQRRDSWAFQDMTVADILTTVFDDYQGAFVPSYRLALGDQYPSRSLLTQYRETDWHFVRRLIEAEGLVCWFEHEGDASSATLGSHTLVISDRVGFDAACQDNAESPLRFHRASVTELDAGDSFQIWEERQGQSPSEIRLLSWDDRKLSQQLVQASLDSAPVRGRATRLADHVSHYAWAGETDGQRRADNLLAGYRAQARHVVAGGTVRSLAPGQTFDLGQHHRYSSEARFRVLAVHHQGRNNLSGDFRATLHHAFGLGEAEAEIEHYRNRTVCLHAGAAIGTGAPIDTPYAPLPEAGRYHDKPTAQGIQTATVVGQGGQAINDDRNHRVKVQFHWQRGSGAHSRHAHPSGQDNAPADASVWAWVRVATPAAGGNWGGVVLPRIGQEVLIGHLDGDIDRPVVLGAAYNGQGNDDAQHNQQQAQAGATTANAPVWFAGEAAEHAHPDAISGIKTQAMGQSQDGQSDKQQGGYNQLVFDDHPQGGRVELGSTQAHSWLQLGQMRHQQDNARREARGHGAQLETQGHSALRGGQGLLLSAHARPGGSGDLIDSQEIQQVLGQQQQRLSALIDRAQKHHAGLDQEAAPGKLPTELGQQQLGDSLAATAGNVAAWGQPDLVHAAPAGVGWLTPKGISLNAAQTLGAVGRDLQMAAQGTLGITAPAGLRVFAGGSKPDTKQPEQTRGLKLAAASGKAVLHAQKDKANVNALKNVAISSNAAVVVASPTTLKLASGGAGIELKGGNITVYAPSGASFKAGQKKMTGAERGAHAFPAMPVSPYTHEVYSQQVNLLNMLGRNEDTGEINTRVPYSFRTKKGAVIQTGITDENGMTNRVYTRQAEDVRLFVGDGEWKFFIDAEHTLPDQS